MGLRELAESHLAITTENRDLGAWDISVKDPADKEESLTGLSTDIAQIIDPDTGMVVSGRMASVALRISTLVSLGFTSLPVGIAESAQKPWVITFDDINGNPYKFKVKKSNPDRAIGLVTCLLAEYSE